MGKQALRCGFVVIWTDNQKSIHSCLFCSLAQFNCMVCRVASCPCNDFALISDAVFCSVKQFQLLIIAERWSFSGGAGNNDSFDPSVNLPFQKLLQHGIIEFIIQKWRHKSGTDSCEKWFCNHIQIPPSQSMHKKRFLPLQNRMKWSILYKLMIMEEICHEDP